MSTRDKLVGPCLVPRNVKHILLDNADTVLLVIPKLGTEDSSSKKNRRARDNPATGSTVKPYVHLWNLLSGALLHLCAKKKHRVVPDEDEEAVGGGERRYSTQQRSPTGSNSLLSDMDSLEVKTVVVATNNLPPDVSDSTANSDLPPDGPPGTPIRL